MVDTGLQLWSMSTQAVEGLATADAAAAAADTSVAMLVSDGHGDVRALFAMEVRGQGAEVRSVTQQRVPVVEHGRAQAALLSEAPAWMAVASREVSARDAAHVRGVGVKRRRC